MKRSLFSALALLFAAALVFALASCAAEPAQTVCISEAMSRNKSVLPDETGAYGDWIELYNPTGEAVDLAGWSLTDDAAKPRQFVFPAFTLESGACLLLFADKTNRIDSENGVFHLPFSIKKEGESLRLFDGKTRLVSVLHVPRLEEN
ncbi:MAG: lamin tail domain-containing protein, partial [Clostridia bacterium]|nr:lamin tail domain-containing protein [Clostridia bacterium]